MEMNLNPVEDNHNQFTSYGDNFVVINNSLKLTNDISVIVNKQIFHYTLDSVQKLNLTVLEEALVIKPDLVLIASKNLGDIAKLMQAFIQQGIGVEIMSIQALCRTFNFLVSEKRRVMAIIDFIS